MPAAKTVDDAKTDTAARMKEVMVREWGMGNRE
jgi:hypothetical protein